MNLLILKSFRGLEISTVILFLSSFENNMGSPISLISTNGLIELFNMKDAKYVIISMGSVCGTIKHVLEKNNIKDVGLIRIKSYRPFPVKELKKSLKNIQSAAVLEKDISIGSSGALMADIKCVSNIPMTNIISGLGGRDITEKMVLETFEHARKGEEELIWL